MYVCIHIYCISLSLFPHMKYTRSPIPKFGRRDKWNILDLSIVAIGFLDELISLVTRSGKSSAEPCRGGQTAQKANIYLGEIWTSYSEQFLICSLMKYH